MMYIQFSLVQTISFITVFYLCLQIKTITIQKKKTIVDLPPPSPPPPQVKKLDKIAFDFIKWRFLDKSEDYSIYTRMAPIKQERFVHSSYI